MAGSLSGVARVRAPELAGEGGWIGAPDGGLRLAGLRGRFVLLDFWTLACVNCQNVVEELRGVERRFAEELVVLGVHSPKFPHEHDHAAVRAAVDRHRLEHPVLDDPAMTTWDQYAVRAWPTLVLVDPEGYEVWRAAGEGHAVALAAELERLIAEHGAKGTLVRGAAAPVAARDELPTGELAFPGKVAVAPDGLAVAISDTGHDRVLVTRLGGEVLHELDGLYQPQGVRFDGDDALLVCETGADRVWRIALPGGERTLVTDAARTPWDVVRWRGHVVVAEAGRHRLLGIDDAGEPQVIAGTTAEGLRDGRAHAAVLAQPSGLAVTADGDLAFVDAESSALRVLRAATLQVETLAGVGLFGWGSDDGDAVRARMQHPLGVAAAPDGALYVADTFNGLLRVWRGAHLWTVPVEGFAEPGGIAVLPDGTLLVADTGHHRVVVVDPVGARAVALAPSTPSAPVVVAAGETVPVTLDVDLDGEELEGVAVTATANVPGLVREPSAWTFDALPATVDVPVGTGAGRVVVELRAATCGIDACRLRKVQRTLDIIVA